MNERLARFGIAPEYRPHVRHFVARAKAWGLSQTDIDAHLEFAAALPAQISDDDLMRRYHAFANTRGMPPEIAGLATEWHAQVNQRGIEALAPPSPLTEADRARLAAIYFAKCSPA